MKSCWQCLRYGELKALSVDSAFGHTQVTNRDMAACCVSAVWLYHNYLDDSHTISQGIHSQEGSFWHGIMHRREPDYPNGKYWFRNVGGHVIFEDIYEVAVELASVEESEAAKAFVDSLDGQWDPYAFIDLVEDAARGANDAEGYCRQVQQCEWWLLFTYCYQQATS